MKLTYMPPANGKIEVLDNFKEHIADLILLENGKQWVSFRIQYDRGAQCAPTLTAEELEEMLAKLKEATK